jgi:ABC-type transport system substrate-binding protein
MPAKRNAYFSFILIAILALVISACAPAPAVAPEAAVTTPEAVEGEVTEELGMDAFTTPHPILSDIRVRHAIAHCIDRDALIDSVYAYVDDEIKPTLRMDTFLPTTHWAYQGPYTDYEYDPDAGIALLEEAGWTLPAGGTVRENAAGEPLELRFTTTDAQFRQTWAAVAEQNLAGCGIALNRQHTPASWWFGSDTGLARRDFELGAFAWVGQADPGGRTLYACNQIPSPANNWEGQNNMGWCNERASEAIIRATNTLVREERIEAYNIVQEEFARDMVSLPLFQRAEAEAWGANLEGLRLDPTEYGTASAAQWTLADGGDTIVVGFSQEPAGLWSLIEQAAVARQVGQVGIGVLNTQYSYDYQPVLYRELSTIEAGLATNEMVTVGPGDMVFNLEGDPEELAAGTELLIDGEVVVYEGEGEVELPQLVVTYRLNPYTWSDGTPGSIADVELAFDINCDEQSGATTFNACRAIQDVEYSENLEYTITYLPGVQDPTYYLAPFSISPSAAIYPSHQVLADGRNLADVPAAEWRTLPEISERPLSFGPFMVTEWLRGQSITLERNPHYAGEVGVERIVVIIVTDTNQAVAQLLSGDVDYLERATLGGGAEIATLLEAAEQGRVNVEILPSPTWEHIDINLNIP